MRSSESNSPRRICKIILESFVAEGRFHFEWPFSTKAPPALSLNHFLHPNRYFLNSNTHYPHKNAVGSVGVVARIYFAIGNFGNNHVPDGAINRPRI